MTLVRQMVMIVPCGAETDAVLDALDKAGVRDWAIIPTSQARRMGHLEYTPPEHEWTSDVFLGIADPDAVRATLEALARGIEAGKLEPDCLAYVWEVKQVSLGSAAFDPVCGMSIDRQHAQSLTHNGVTYYFCAPECRERFEKDPYAFVKA